MKQKDQKAFDAAEQTARHHGIICGAPSAIAFEKGWQAALEYERSNQEAKNKAEVVGHVYTMEALVPGSDTRCHVQLYKPLPLGTNLYTTPQPDRTAELEAQVEMFREALELADAALEGAHMNPDVLYKKVKTALAETRGAES